MSVSLHEPPALADLPEEAEGQLSRLHRVSREELAAINPVLLLAVAATAPLPRYAFSRLRAAILRALGFRIERGVLLMDLPRMGGVGDIRSKLTIGKHSLVNVGCFFDLNGAITIGYNVGIGHEVMVLTTSHKMGPPEQRHGPTFIAPVRIEDGAWIGARTTILPGVTIGAGAVVAAGAMVIRDVAPNSLVGGVPAKVISQQIATP